jgi:hypothetical protein
MKTDAAAGEPELFISYSWTSPDHEAWVLKFAEDLASQGVNVVLDKWDLKPGHDANAFMESMVTKPSVKKVVLVCDEAYVKKSDGRSGGAGTEAQIISPKLYAETQQDKFVAVVRERDANGKAFLPAYYGGRIYIDLSNASSYGSEFDRLLRWVFDKPLYVRPEKGAVPAFLDETRAPAKIASSVVFHRASEAIRSNAPNSAAALSEYFDLIIGGLELFRVKTADNDRNTFDDVVVSSIDEFTPYRNELIELFATIARYAPQESMLITLHRFFEKCIPFMNTPSNVHTYMDWDYDNYRFVVHELFLYCIAAFLKLEHFNAAAYFVDVEYYWVNRFDNEKTMHQFTVFREHVRTFEHRNARLNFNRLSVRADKLKERNAGTGVEFQYIMAADFILYYRGETADRYGGWFPETLLYVDRHAGPFEMFSRAKSKAYFEKIKALLAVGDKAEFEQKITEISERGRLPRWQFDSINPASLSGMSTLASSV